MTTLSNHEVLMKLVSAMKDNGRELLAEGLINMSTTLDYAEAQHKLLLSMTRYANEQFAGTSEQDHSATEHAPAQVFQAEMEQILSQYSTTKKRIIAWGKATMEDFKQVGVSALDSALPNLEALNLLGEMQEQYDNSMGRVMASLQQTDSKQAEALFSLIGHISPKRLESIASKAAGIVWQEQENGKKVSIRGQLEKKKEEVTSRSSSIPVKRSRDIER